jgi:hypothetical protein
MLSPRGGERRGRGSDQAVHRSKPSVQAMPETVRSLQCSRVAERDLAEETLAQDMGLRIGATMPGETVIENANQAAGVARSMTSSLCGDATYVTI